MTNVVKEYNILNRARNDAPRELSRWWSHVDKRNANECWEWRAVTNWGGYGIFMQRNKKVILAHRFAYKTFVAPIPRGLSVCHTCDNRRCMNPAHLWVGTLQDNMDDMNHKGRGARGERHGNARLSSTDVVAIRQLRQLGLRPGHLADTFGIDRNYAYAIISRRVRSNG